MDSLDLCEGLFGWVNNNIDDNKPLKERKEREKSVRSRVKFGFLTAQKKGELLPTKLPGLKPRPSFFPFYIKSNQPNIKSPIEFDHENAILAGRKKYPVRGRTNQAPTVGDEQAKTVHFLRKNHVFTGKIKVHNLCPEEFGALIWSLMLGQYGNDDHGFRHVLGRGKPFGYGQIRLSIKTITDRQGKILDETVIENAVVDFKKWVLQNLEREVDAFEALEPIKRLLNACHPETGNALVEANALLYPGGNADSENILKAHSKLRKIAITGKDINENTNLRPYPRKV